MKKRLTYNNNKLTFNNSLLTYDDNRIENGFEITFNSYGNERSLVRFQTTTTSPMTMNGSGYFCTNLGVNLGQTATLTSGGLRDIWLKVPSGSSTLTIGNKDSITKWGGELSLDETSNPIGFYCGSLTSPRFNMNIIDLPNNLICLNLSEETRYILQGNVSNLPSNLVVFAGNNSSGITGNISDLPRSLTYFSYGQYGHLSANGLYGNMDNLPSGLTTFRSLINNTFLSGTTANLPRNLYRLQTTYTYLNGSISNLPRNLNKFQIYSSGIISGNTSDFPTGLTEYDNYCWGQTSNYPSLSGNTSDLPRNLNRFFYDGYNYITGDLSNLPTNLIYFEIDNQSNVYDKNTITGDINFFSSNTNLLTLKINGNNTIYGSLSDVPNQMYGLLIGGNNTLNSYTSGKLWNSSFTSLYIWKSAVHCDLSTTDVDNILIDIDNSGSNYGVITINQVRTSASDTAYNSLISKGWGVYLY